MSNRTYCGNSNRNRIGMVLMTGALALVTAGAQAQGTSAPYGSLGFNNIYGIGVYSGLGGSGGLGGTDAFNSYFGVPVGSFFGTPIGGSSIRVVGDSYYGSGFSAVGQNGTYFSGPNGPYNPYLNPNGGNPVLGPQQPTRGNDDKSANTQAATDLPDHPSPDSLAQAIIIKRGRNFDISVGWRGDPKLLGSMKVTLLNRYHLPLAQQEAVSESPAYFGANRDTYAARYYRVDVTYADGAVATMTGRLTR